VEFFVDELAQTKTTAQPGAVTVSGFLRAGGPMRARSGEFVLDREGEYAQAIAIDPGYARTYVGLAGNLYFGGLFGDPRGGTPAWVGAHRDGLGVRAARTARGGIGVAEGGMGIPAGRRLHRTRPRALRSPRGRDRCLEEAARRSRRKYVPAYDVAVVYEGLGERQRALEWLDTAAREHSGFVIHAAWDPRFASLKNEPAFRARCCAACRCPSIGSELGKRPTGRSR
jgi:hypothetical protein